MALKAEETIFSFGPTTYKEADYASVADGLIIHVTHAFAYHYMLQFSYIYKK